MTNITTLSGDTWDSIAWRVWGKGADQSQMAALIAANSEHIDTAIFGGGITLTVPAPEEYASVTIPPWRR